MKKYIMEDYTNTLKENLGKDRNFPKEVYKLLGLAYRGVANGRTTWENILKLSKR